MEILVLLSFKEQKCVQECHYATGKWTQLLADRSRRQCRSRDQVWFLHSRTSPWTWRPLRSLCCTTRLSESTALRSLSKLHSTNYSRLEVVWVAPKASGFELVHSRRGFEESYNSLVRFRDAFCGSSARQSAVAGVISCDRHDSHWMSLVVGWFV